MKKLCKVLSCIAASVFASVAMSMAVFADEYSFDMEKAKQTHGGGQSYMSFTRLDNERRDMLKFNPLWITPESTIEIDYVSEGEYEDQPMNLVFQSWIGALVESTEDKWVQIPPTDFSETHATWSYDTIVSVYGEDFSDVYAIVIEDSGTNSLLVTNITVTNLSVPADERENVGGGILVITETDETITETTAAETLEITDTQDAGDEKVGKEETEKVSKETSVETENDSSAKTQTTKSSEDKNEDAESGIPAWLIIAIGGGVFSIVIIIIVIALKHRNNGWH